MIRRKGPGPEIEVATGRRRPPSAGQGRRMRRGESRQGSGDPERGLCLSLSTFPGSYKVATTKKEGQDRGKGWDRAAMAGARFGVTTVYLVLRLPGGGSCAGMGVLQAAISKQTRGRGACDFVSGRGAPWRPCVSPPVSGD